MLTAFSTMPNAMSQVTSLSIRDATLLRTVSIGDNSFNKVKDFTLNGAAALEAFEVGDHCFEKVREFDLSCIPSLWTHPQLPPCWRPSAWETHPSPTPPN